MADIGGARKCVCSNPIKHKATLREGSVMDITATLAVVGIGSSLIGTLVLVREVRYAQLVEYHNLNLDEILRKAEEFENDPALYIKKSTYEMFGEKVVNAFGEISEEEWKKADPDHVRDLEQGFRKSVAKAKEWKQRVPFRALQKRMQWLTTGSILLVAGAVLQATAVVL